MRYHPLLRLLRRRRFDLWQWRTCAGRTCAEPEANLGSTGLEPELHPNLSLLRLVLRRRRLRPVRVERGAHARREPLWWHVAQERRRDALRGRGVGSQEEFGPAELQLRDEPAARRAAGQQVDLLRVWVRVSVGLVLGLGFGLGWGDQGWRD